MSVKNPNTVTMLCEPCGDDRAFVRKMRDHAIAVRGEKIAVRAPVLVCPVCGHAEADPSESGDPLPVAYAEYRRLHGLLAPERIREIRERYGLSREAFAAVLGMSPATLYRYEGGALQDDLNDTMIFACDDPKTMERLLNRRRDRISNLQYERFQEAMNRLAAAGHGSSAPRSRVG